LEITAHIPTCPIHQRREHAPGVSFSFCLFACHQHGDLSPGFPGVEGDELICERLDEIAPMEESILPFYRALAAHGAPRVRLEGLPNDHEFSRTREHRVRMIVDWLHTAL
jgi:hypothetical protein